MMSEEQKRMTCSIWDEWNNEDRSDQTEGQVMKDCHQINQPISARQISNEFDSNQPMRAREIWNEFDSGGEDS